MASFSGYTVVSNNRFQIDYNIAVTCMSLPSYFIHAGLGLGLVTGTKCIIISTLFSLVIPCRLISLSMKPHEYLLSSLSVKAQITISDQ